LFRIHNITVTYKSGNFTFIPHDNHNTWTVNVAVFLKQFPETPVEQDLQHKQE